VIFGTGLLTMSYQGLFDLAKQFLDPYDNESYGRGEDPLCVDTLIAETNAGSIRWLYGFEELPYSVQRLNDGELYEYLLPVRGYSVEELDQMEKEQIEREMQLEVQRKREDEEAAEDERLRKEAEEKLAAEIEEEKLVAEKEAEEKLAAEKEAEEKLAAEKEEGTTEKDEEEEGTTENDDEDDLDGHLQKEDKVEITATEVSSNVELPALDSDSKIESMASVGNTTILEKDERTISPTVVPAPNATKSTAESAEISSDSNATKSTISGAAKETRPVHKVTTLATDKSAISSFTSSEPVKQAPEEPVPSGMTTSNYLATLRMQNEKIKSLLARSELDKNNLEEELIDFEAFEDLPWFDEIGADGQEIRLSQQLADEDWEEEKDDIQITNMTREEYELRLREIEEDAENELKETIEIMSALPGAEGDDNLYIVTERRKKKAPTYDQTRLDGISQLWGLPPEDPSALNEYEPPEKIDDTDFNFVSQLWGDRPSASSGTQTTTQDESEVVGLEDFSGISELWGPAMNDFEDISESQGLDRATRNQEIDSEDKRNGDDEVDFPSFARLPWHDEKGPDGKEYRLSELLADEEWVTEPEIEETPPMTIEDYNKEVEKIITKAEEELRETEAILLSKPGTDPVGWDYDDEQLAPMSNVTASEESEEEQEIEDSDLDVLEMDPSDDYGMLAAEVYSNDVTNPEGANGDEETEALVEGVESIAHDSDQLEIESSGDKETTNNGGKDEIELISIKEQEEKLTLEDDESAMPDFEGDEEDDLRL